jgi:hypothetical protein
MKTENLTVFLEKNARNLIFVVVVQETDKIRLNQFEFLKLNNKNSFE